MNKRDRIIALTVCSIIFVVVLVISITAASGNSEDSKEINTSSSGTQTAPPPASAAAEVTSVQQPLQPVETPKKTSRRFKRSNVPEHYNDFDFSAVKQLPRSIDERLVRAGILIDLDSRKVLWEKSSSKPVPIASLTKLLTIYTAFEELERRPELALDTPVTVSRECTLVANVKAPLTAGDKVKLHELFVFSMLKSSNDASHLLAEYFGYGQSGNFIRLMNRKAAEIGMGSSHFVNANGLPIYRSDNDSSPQMNMASCHDVAKLIERAYEYPMIIRYTSSRQANTSKGVVASGNQLLGRVSGMEGMKTGYTNAAGNCLAFSCKRNGRRLIGVVTGVQNRRACFEFTAKLLEWGYRN